MASYDIKVIGVGGGGSNTIDYIMENEIGNINTYAVNTDAQALGNSKADNKIHIGKVSTNGLGAGALPEIGRAAAEESSVELRENIAGADIVFVAAGMGGGTGTGAAPYVAQLSKELGILTIGIVTKPFNFEGPSRMKMALEGIKKLEENCDVTIVIPNEKLIQNYRDYYVEDAFILPDSVLKTAIEAIVNILESVSQFASNVDLNTLRNTLSNKGLAVMGIGESSDPDLTSDENLHVALKNAINSEILEVSVHGAQQFITLITANIKYIQFSEMENIGQYLSNELGYGISNIVPLSNDETMKENERKITIIATDYKDKEFIEKITKDNTQRTSFDDSLFVGL